RVCLQKARSNARSSPGCGETSPRWKLKRPSDDRRIDRAVQVLPHGQSVGMIGDCRRADLRLRVLDQQSRAAVPVQRLLRIQPQLLANALNEDVLLGRDAGLLDVAMRRS